MGNLKVFGIAAVAAMALMAFAASSASATALYNGATKLGVSGELDFSLKSGTSALLVDTEGGELDKCSGSTLKGNITNAGGAGASVSANIADEVKESKTVTGLTWTGCTFPTTTTSSGGFDVSQIGTSTEGTFKVNKETGFTVNTVVFGTCGYFLTKSIHLGGSISGSAVTASLTLRVVGELSIGSNFACPQTAVLTATYISTTPDNLRVEAS